MPTIFRYKGYRFFFYSNENIPLEPCHIHVRKGSSLAKFWIEDEILLAETYGFISPELKEIMKIIEQNKELIKEKWNEYFNIK